MAKPPTIFIGKMLVPLGWYPSRLTPQGAFYKGIYPINTHYIRCIWGRLLRVPSQGYQHFPYDRVSAQFSTSLPVDLRINDPPDIYLDREKLCRAVCRLPVETTPVGKQKTTRRGKGEGYPTRSF